MIYIITEDSNSAREFWENIANNYTHNYVMVQPINNESGNTTLLKQINNIVKIAKPGDKIFIAFDNIKGNKHFIPKNFIKKAISICRKYNVKMQYTKYYCFEEVYLSYDEIPKLIGNKYRKLVTYIHNCINNHIDYYNANKLVINYIKENNIKNKEHFVNSLLSEVTQPIPGRFFITKRGRTFLDRGKCWLQDCNIIQEKMQEQAISNICNEKCKYTCKGCNKNTKIDHLNKNCMFRNSGISKEI